MNFFVLLLFYESAGADLGGATRPSPPPPIFTCKNFLEPYICPCAITCLKISSCIDLKCLLYVCATVKVQFVNTILDHTHPPLGRHTSSHVHTPPFENFGSAPDQSTCKTIILKKKTLALNWHLKEAICEFGLSMLMLILINLYIFTEVMRYLHNKSGLEAIMHFKTHCFVYKQS